MKKIITWFTLIELIVSILVLTILTTISIVIFQWYTLHARDALRISDILNTKTSLWLYFMENASFPLPDNWYNVSYEWDLLWVQWVFWDNVWADLSQSLVKKPIDPLTNTEYIYSVSNLQEEYEILVLYESDIVYENSINLTNRISVLDNIYPKIEWTYNKIFIKTPNHIIPLPSIINAELNWEELILSDDNITSQVVTWWGNLPSNWIKLSQTWWVNIILQAYTWSTSIYMNNVEKEQLALIIQNVYVDSILSEDDFYSSILDKANTVELVNFVNEVVFRNVATFEVLFNCVKRPNFLNATFTDWIPTWPEQSWQNSNSLEPCYYECDTNYTWNGSICQLN